MVCGARVRRSIPRSRRASSRLRRPQASQEGAGRASTRGWRFPALTSMSRSESIKADKRRFNVIAGCTDATTPTNVARRLHKIDPCPSPCRRHARPCPPPCPPDCVRHASACPQRHGGGIREVDLKSRAGRHAVGIPSRCWRHFVSTRRSRTQNGRQPGNCGIRATGCSLDRTASRSTLAPIMTPGNGF